METKTSNEIVGKTAYKFVPKGWGFERWIWNDSSYCGKLLFIAKDRKCSWHYHKLKKETFYVQQGELHVFYGWDDDPVTSEHVLLKPGDVFHVPTGLRHQMRAETDTHLFEFSTEHFDEDSIRILKGD
jgi:mannose-6-phosphate isomerase-like protein (cupin superfamily)